MKGEVEVHEKIDGALGKECAENSAVGRTAEAEHGQAVGRTAEAEHGYAVGKSSSGMDLNNEFT